MRRIWVAVLLAIAACNREGPVVSAPLLPAPNDPGSSTDRMLTTLASYDCALKLQEDPEHPLLSIHFQLFGPAAMRESRHGGRFTCYRTLDGIVQKREPMWTVGVTLSTLDCDLSRHVDVGEHIVRTGTTTSGGKFITIAGLHTRKVRVLDRWPSSVPDSPVECPSQCAIERQGTVEFPYSLPPANVDALLEEAVLRARITSWR